MPRRLALAGLTRSSLLALSFVPSWSGGARAARSSTTLPFVGCASYGQSGFVPAPTGPSAVPAIAAVSAKDLADYTSTNRTVLAPRGWHCIEGYGSGGTVLLVTPRPDTAETLPGFSSVAGPAVELVFVNGENSGRNEVAEIVSRLFPPKRRLIDGVASPWDVTPRYPHGPGPSDRTVRRDRSEVDYTTSPHRDGMGTFGSRLAPGAEPIEGAAFLTRSDGVDSVVLLNVRLPPRLSALAPVILDAERRRRADRIR